MINSVGTVSQGVWGNYVNPKLRIKTEENFNSSIYKTEPVISSFAKQLLESSMRLENLTKNLDFKQLNIKAKDLLAQVLDGDFSNKGINDAEDISNPDPNAIALEKQATAYLNKAVHGDCSVPNPFSNLNRDQLDSIIYDDSGAFTLNERRAAFYEAADREEEWSLKVISQAMQEYNRTGKFTEFFKNVLEHFLDLPRIEQVFYPANYAASLSALVQSDSSYL